MTGCATNIAWYSPHFTFLYNFYVAVSVYLRSMDSSKTLLTNTFAANGECANKLNQHSMTYKIYIKIGSNSTQFCM